MLFITWVQPQPAPEGIVVRANASIVIHCQHIVDHAIVLKKKKGTIGMRRDPCGSLTIANYEQKILIYNKKKIRFGLFDLLFKIQERLNFDLFY